MGYSYDLDAYKQFLNYFEAPHKRLNNVILIGGTKGKGSTASIISACLMNNGYRVGLYTSPHLSELNERIKIDNSEISDADLDRFAAQLKPLVAKKTGARSFFEALTTIAFLYFLEQRVDFTVLEVGLGGRLDATNATDPSVSVITRIGYDHTNLLGKTLGGITREKAAIIRENGTLVTIHQRPSAECVLKRIAAERKSKVVFADELHNVAVIDQSLRGSRVSIIGPLGEMDTSLPLVGPHQIENLCIAMAVLLELRTRGIVLELKNIEQGIKNTRLRGRFEVISEKPLIIFDCAHNEDSYRALENCLDICNIDDFYLIFGSNRDKDIRYCLKHIFQKAREVFLVKADNPRAIEPEELYRRARMYQPEITLAGSVKNALDLLEKGRITNLPIIIAGSFYLWPKRLDGLPV